MVFLDSVLEAGGKNDGGDIGRQGGESNMDTQTDWQYRMECHWTFEEAGNFCSSKGRRTNYLVSEKRTIESKKET